MRTPTKTGIALLALLALGGVASSAATASTFQSALSPVRIFGAQDPVAKHKFTVDELPVQCGVFELIAAAVTTPANTVTLTPKFGECSVFNFAVGSSEVSTGGCSYELMQPTGLEGKFALRCPSGKALRFYASGWFSECEVLIPETFGIAKISYSNNGGSPEKVGADFSLSGIDAVKTIDWGLCGLAGTGVVTNVSVSGKTNFEANEVEGKKASVDLWIE